MEAIAIVGLAGRFAGAPAADAFWRNVVAGRSSLVPLAGDVLPPFGVKAILNGRRYPRTGGRLGENFSCVPYEQTCSVLPEAGGNPDVRFAVQLAFDAVADAGMMAHAPDPVRGTVRLAYAPVFDPASVTWLEHTFFTDQALDLLRRYFPTAPEESMANVRRELCELLPKPSADAFAEAMPHHAADCVARECSFAGEASAVDAGCLSAFDALAAACDDLRSGRADVALVGAVSPPLGRPFLEGMCGRVDFTENAFFAPFDREADGTVPGEGGAFFVLRRRSDALRMRDRIYALVKGGAFSQNDPGLAEADGSGVPDADHAEIAALRALWGEHAPGGALVGVGSVKGNVGHCFAAAGAAGLLKAALALHMRVLPPQVPVRHPPEGLGELNSSVYLLERARPWITGNPARPRRAALLGRSFPGRAAAVILEEEPEGRL